MMISVIIPTLNEDAVIAATLASVAAQTPPWEIVIADGASSDNTVAQCRGLATVIAAPEGRASQMNGGAHVARGDVLFFLHADTLLPAGALDAIREALADSAAEAGTFRVMFDRRNTLLQVYGAFSRLPLHGLCFGDRGLFVRRSVFEHVHGFPEIPLFEDLAIVRLLHKRGGFRFLKPTVVTSARRFTASGVLWQQCLNIFLWIAYHLGADPENLAQRYNRNAGAAGQRVHTRQ